MLYTTEQSNANTIATEQKELRTIRKWKDLLKKKHPQIDGNKSGKKRPRKNQPKVRKRLRQLGFIPKNRGC